MKRYKLEIALPREHVGGEWCKADEVDAEIKRLTDIYEGRIASLSIALEHSNKMLTIDRSGEIHYLTSSEIECNCAEMFRNYRSHMPTDPYWICPAHGYKKL